MKIEEAREILEKADGLKVKLGERRAHAIVEPSFIGIEIETSHARVALYDEAAIALRDELNELYPVEKGG